MTHSNVESTLESLGSLLEKTVSRFGLKKKSDQWKVVQQWPFIVGETLAKLSRPVSIRDGVLFVAVPSSTWAQELDFQKNEILKRISALFDKDLIQDIRFFSSSWKEKKEFDNPKEASLSQEEKKIVEAMCQEIENPRLKPVIKKWLTSLILLKKQKNA
jgi:predicted nucleic acid-binding Zn ribbon protein